MSSLKTRRKLFILLFTILFFITAIVFGVRYFVFRMVKKSLYSRIQLIREKGFNISFDSVTLDPWNGHLSVRNLKAGFGKDSTQKNIELSVQLLLIRDINVLPFIINKELKIKDILIYRPHLIYQIKTKFSEEEQQLLLQGIRVGHLHLSDASVILKDSTGMDTTLSLTMSMDAKKLTFRNERDSLAWKEADVNISNAKIDVPHSFYSYSIHHVNLSLNKQVFTLDSLRIIPLYDKVTFVRKANQQVSRLDVIVPKLIVQGLILKRDREIQISARKMTLNFKIEAFRNKKYPFLKKTIAELPIQFIQKLPLQLKTDSILINDGFVRYEELADKGDSIGFVFFQNINSLILNVHNQPSKEKADDIVMKTTARFMNKGDLDATFTYPADTTKPYRAEGSLKNFPIHYINSILTPATRARVESGKMNSLHFNFIYNNYRSDGMVRLNYHNLKIVSLQENKDHEKTVNGVKTLLINTLVLKREMNSDIYDNEGTILFYRDPRRAIFHYWWQSLFSGIKSVYGLDKILPSTKPGEQLTKKKERKEERKMKRQIRRAKRQA